MEMTWNNMEKKEKLMWIKKAAEDQKRYEVGWAGLLVSVVQWGGAGRSWGQPPPLKTWERPLVGVLLSSPHGAWSPKSQPWLCDPEKVS